MLRPVHRARGRSSGLLRDDYTINQLSYSNTILIRNGHRHAMTTTRAFDQNKVELQNSTRSDSNTLSALPDKERSPSLLKFLNNAEKRMDELEQKYAGKAQKRFQKLQRKLSRKLERLEGSLEIRPSLKRISSSPKLMVLAVAACLVAIPAGSLAFSFAAGVLQVVLI
jgi:uncharacterized protein YukE